MFSSRKVSSEKVEQKNLHVILLGDSIFDNGVYVQPDGPPVIEQLQKKLSGWKEVKAQCTLLARDGNVIANIEKQASKIPKDATHLFVSIEATMP